MKQNKEMPEVVKGEIIAGEPVEIHVLEPTDTFGMQLKGWRKWG